MKLLFQILCVSLLTLSLNAQPTTLETPPPASKNTNSSTSTSKSDNKLRFKSKMV